MIRPYAFVALAALLLPLAACTAEPSTPPPPAAASPPPSVSAPAPGASTPRAPAPGASTAAGTAPRDIRSWAYQLQDYAGGTLDQLAAGDYELIVIDLARDAHEDWFRADELAKVRATGKRVLAYFEIGSLEDFRPEYPVVRREAPDLLANEWGDWPGEFFVRYYDERWWDLVVRHRVDQAIEAGFDGVYLDTPLAYEEIDLASTQGRDRERLAKDMADLIVRISGHAKQRKPGFLIVPQNSPELRHQDGYTAAVDGIGMEELFYQATDERCTEDYCAENLAETRALRDAGKFVLSVDYASRPADVRTACKRYESERFAGTVTVLELDRPSPPCT